MSEGRNESEDTLKAFSYESRSSIRESDHVRYRLRPPTIFFPLSLSEIVFLSMVPWSVPKATEKHAGWRNKEVTNEKVMSCLYIKVSANVHLMIEGKYSTKSGPQEDRGKVSIK